MENSLEILTVSLFQLDIESNTKSNIPVDVGVDDLSDYLKDLLAEVDTENKKRSFEFDRDTTEVFVALKLFFQKPNLSEHNDGATVAERLLKSEVSTDKKYGHLSANKKGSHVKKGSYLQFLYKDSGELKYLGVKVDHQGYLDEKDLKKHTGLALTDKVYKAFRVSAENGVPTEIDVYDSQKKISKYWWHDFLELVEARSDSYNTKEACQATMAKINQIKPLSIDDYKELRNAVIVAFKQQGAMDYIQFVEDTIENYVSENNEVRDKIAKITPDLKKLPELKNFDSKFDLDSTAVPYRKSTYKLSNQITLTVDEGVNDLDNKIWSERTADGDELVVIKSSEGFKEFKIKERAL
jgi:hypothetical protein